MSDTILEEDHLWEIHIKLFSPEATGPIATKLWWNGPWMAPFQIVSDDPDFQPRWPPEFPIGSYAKLSSAVGAILVEGPNAFLEENHPMTISSKFSSY
jgi:hypothetical protein